MLALALTWTLAGYVLYLAGVLWFLPGREILGLFFGVLVGGSLFWGKRSGLLKSITEEIRKLWGYGLIEKVLVCFIFLQLVLSLGGVLSPELSFDALWYHLSLPKMYLDWGKIMFPKGNLLQSGLPRLGEMWYTMALATDSSSTTARSLHLLGGFIAFLLMYHLAERLSSRRAAILAAAAWYTMLSVGWLSTSGYVDLFAVVFVLLAAQEIVDGKRLWLGGLLLGFGASVKLVFLLPGAMTSLLIFIKRPRAHGRLRSLLMFLSGLVLAIIPWLGLSWIMTGDPLYPLIKYQPTSVFGAPLANLAGRLVSVVIAPWWWTMRPDTPISPIYLGFLPLMILSWKRFKDEVRQYFALGGIFILSVWLFPEFSNRYLLPGLALMTIPIAAMVASTAGWQRRMLVGFVIVTVMANVFSRAIVSRKFVPYLLGEESRDTFLEKNLNLRFGNFFDKGAKIAELTHSRTVLVVGIHNIFYVDFPFDHISWASEPGKYRYILVGRDGTLPSILAGVRPVYRDNLTGAVLYVNDKAI